MELIEGAPIGDHFTSLKEKGERFSEDRIWHIFLQNFKVARNIAMDITITRYSNQI